MKTVARRDDSLFDAWLDDPDRRPLILRGARQVGKTHLVRRLAKRSGRELFELNFQRDPGLRKHFESNDPREILSELSLLRGREIDPSVSLLFLDEIQAAGELLAKLRWFYEELPVLPVVAAGSLLEFTLADHDFSMPVGRVAFRHVEPLSFPEYVGAVESGPLLETISEWRPGDDLSPAAHERASRLFERYSMVGGMPVVVAADADGRSTADCRDLQRELVATYRADFAKYSGRMDRDIIDATLTSVAGSIGSKFIYSRVRDGIRSDQAKKALELLASFHVVQLARHTAGNGLPLAAEVNEKYRKASLVDVGLLHALLGTPAVDAFPPRDSITPTLRGQIADQLGAQQLRLLGPSTGDGPELFYWQRKGSRAGEIDYVAQIHGRVVPIELKSGSSGSMRSLHQFVFDKKLELAVRCDTNPPSTQDLSLKTTRGDPVSYRLVSLPLYLLWNLDAILE